MLFVSPQALPLALSGGLACRAMGAVGAAVCLPGGSPEGLVLALVNTFPRAAASQAAAALAHEAPDALLQTLELNDLLRAKDYTRLVDALREAEAQVEFGEAPAGLDLRLCPKCRVRCDPFPWSRLAREVCFTLLSCL